MHIISDSAGHSVILTDNQISQIKAAISSTWAQVNMVFDTITVEDDLLLYSFGDRVVFATEQSPDYLEIISSSSTATFNIYFVFALGKSTSTFSCGLTVPGVHHSIVSVSNNEISGLCLPFAGHATAHELGHAFSPDMNDIGSDQDLKLPFMYELMWFRANGGNTITPAQGRLQLINP